MQDKSEEFNIEVPLYEDGLLPYGYPDNNKLIDELVRLCVDHQVTALSGAQLTAYEFNVSKEDEAFLLIKYPNYRQYMEYYDR